MYNLDLSVWGGFVSAVWNVAVGVLKLAPNAFLAADALTGGWKVALVIVFLAGLSDMLGQSVVLFANRVTPRRFTVSLLMSALVLVISAVVWIGSIWLVLRFIFGLEGRFYRVFVVVSLSYAPLLFGFLSLLPYLGAVPGWATPCGRT